jgi:hypothetical protein
MHDNVLQPLSDRRVDREEHILGCQGTNGELNSNVANASNHPTRSLRAILHKIKCATLPGKFDADGARHPEDMR